MMLLPHMMMMMKMLLLLLLMMIIKTMIRAAKMHPFQTSFGSPTPAARRLPLLLLAYLPLP
jgi:hypothetical protein